MTLGGGLFGRKGNGRNTLCPRPPFYDGCGEGGLESMPEIVYGNLLSSNFGGGFYEKSIPMYRYAPPSSDMCITPSPTDICDCNDPPARDGVRYLSPLMYISDQDPTLQACCIGLELIGSRNSETGECTWVLSAYNPIDETYYTEAAMDGMFDEVTFVFGEQGNDCIEPGTFGTVSLVITTSEEPQFSAAELCDKLCCPEWSQTMYLTIHSECDRLDGQVVTLQYNFIAVLDSLTGNHNYGWSGYLDVCDCGNRMFFDLATHAFSGTQDPRPNKCGWGLSINGGDCFEQSLFSNSNPYCPTITFSGTLNTLETCSECCPPLTESPITIELNG